MNYFYLLLAACYFIWFMQTPEEAGVWKIFCLLVAGYFVGRAFGRF